MHHCLWLSNSSDPVAAHMVREVTICAEMTANQFGLCIPNTGASCHKISSGYPHWKSHGWLCNSLKMHTSFLNLQGADGRHIPVLPSAASDSYRDLFIWKERPELRCTTWLLLTHLLLCLSSHNCTVKFTSHPQHTQCEKRKICMSQKNTPCLINKNKPLLLESVLVPLSLTLIHSVSC